MLDLPYQYHPHGSRPKRWHEFEFKHDDAKLNLLWLIHPTVDDLWHTDWAGDAVSYSINEYLDLDTRNLLHLQPQDFIKQWVRPDKAQYEMTQAWPDDWPRVMDERARTAQRRLFPQSAKILPFCKPMRKVATAA